MWEVDILGTSVLVASTYIANLYWRKPLTKIGNLESTPVETHRSRLTLSQLRTGKTGRQPVTVRVCSESLKKVTGGCMSDVRLHDLSRVARGMTNLHVALQRLDIEAVKAFIRVS